jgi:hypothetical protein
MFDIIYWQLKLGGVGYATNQVTEKTCTHEQQKNNGSCFSEISVENRNQKSIGCS